MENDIGLVNTGQMIEYNIGWVTYRDLATQTTPINLATGGQWYQITNDGLGDFTDKTHAVDRFGEIWNTSTNELDFSKLSVGDMIDIRLDLTVNTPNANTEVETRIVYDEGGANEFSHVFDQTLYKASGDHPMNRYFGFSITRDFVRDNPAQIQIKSDTSLTTAKVFGIYIRTIARY